MNQKYLVNVDALGFATGIAKKGETVTAQQVGEENLARLVTDGTLTLIPENTAPSEAIAAKPATAPEVEPETPQARLALGLPPMEGRELSEEEKAWVKDVKEGVVPVPFNESGLDNVTKKQIGERIVALGGEEVDPSKKTKTELLELLLAQVEAYFGNWEVD